jgi:hypothetical protein
MRVQGASLGGAGSCRLHRRARDSGSARSRGITTARIRITRVTSSMRATATPGASSCRTLNSHSRVSRAELCAYSKNFARSGPVVREYPSAMFVLMDSTASSSWSTRRRVRPSVRRLRTSARIRSPRNREYRYAGRRQIGSPRMTSGMPSAHSESPSGSSMRECNPRALFDHHQGIATRHEMLRHPASTSHQHDQPATSTTNQPPAPATSWQLPAVVSAADRGASPSIRMARLRESR